MATATARLICTHCSAVNTPTRDVCFRCREPLHRAGGSTTALPSVFDQSVGFSLPAPRVWHEVSAPGVALGADGSRHFNLVVREVGTDSLVFDSDQAYQPSEGLTLEFTLEGVLIRLDTTVRRSARTLNVEMPYATTVDFDDPGEEYLSAVSQMNMVDDKAWWD